MARFHKTIRYYYWLTFSFIRKNAKVIIGSIVTSFLLVFLLINYFPLINSLFFKKSIKIGYIGRFNFENLPTEILDEISNPLVTVNSKGEIIPILVKSWEISKDQKKYTFHLKPNLTWNDGKAFTAYDINFNLKGMQIKPVNNNTVEFTLAQPLSIFPVYLNKPIIKSPLKGVGGQWQVQGYNIKKGYFSYINLSPNKTDLEYRTYIFYDNEDKMTTAYKKGEINFMTTTKKPLADFFVNWTNTIVKRDINYNQIMTLFFNNNSEILKSKEVRKAIAYAVPDFKDYGETAGSPIPPTSWAYNPDIKKYTFDIDKAQTQYEKNASPGATLNFFTFYEYINVAEKIKENLEKIGVKVNLRVLSYMPTDYDLLLTIWNPPLDPDQYYFWHSTQTEGNITNYKNVKIDKLLEDGRKFTTIDERKKAYFDFQRNIMEDLPAHFMYYPYTYTIERK